MNWAMPQATPNNSLNLTHYGRQRNSNVEPPRSEDLLSPCELPQWGRAPSLDRRVVSLKQNSGR